MEWISEPKNIKIDLVDMFVIILVKVGPKNIIELGKVKLIKVEQNSIEQNELNEL